MTTDTLFNIPPTNPTNTKELAKKNKTTCRYCKHRIRMEQNFSYKIHQCCGKRPTRRNTDGYEHIKVDNPACAMFEREE